MSPPLACSRAGLRVAVAAFASLVVLILAVTQGCTARPLLHAPPADIGTSDRALPSGHAAHVAASALGLLLIAARLRIAGR